MFFTFLCDLIQLARQSNSLNKLEEIFYLDMSCNNIKPISLHINELITSYLPKTKGSLGF